MKNRVLLFLVSMISIVSFSQVTSGINYQAIARDNNNVIIANQDVSIRLSIISNSINGSVIYLENHQVKSDISGIINLVIGQGVSSDDFSAIEWGSSSHYLKTEIDVTGGVNFIDLGTVQFASVPYAKYAETVGAVEVPLSQILAEGNNAGAVQIKNLADPTDDKDAVTKEYVDALIARIEVLEQSGGGNNGGNENQVTDIDGNVYKTVQIGNQVWMTENLKVTKYNDGSSLSHITDGVQWYENGIGLSVNNFLPAYCYYDNNPANRNVHGALYNGHVFDNEKNICPVGWHVPSRTEFEVLRDFAGGVGFGGKLKEEGTENWTSTNIDVTNETGFTAVPGGMRVNANGEFILLGSIVNYWSVTKQYPGIIYVGQFRAEKNRFETGTTLSRGNGGSIRCLKD